MIAIWWIGEGDGQPALLDGVRRHVEHEYLVPAVVGAAIGRPAGTFDARRRQHSSRAVLEWLLDRRPPDAMRVLGVTDVDLFMPVLTFVFGEAQLGGTAAVVSLARLAAPGRDTMRTRLLKESVHELGHTFGLLHCMTPGCVMGRSASVAAVDQKSSRLCAGCRIRYRELQQDGSHVYREYENPDRR